MTRFLSIVAVVCSLFVGCFAKPSAALEPIPDKLVVLTFDDSVKSHATVAGPLLKRYGFGATFFITEGFNFPTNKKDYMTWREIRKLHDDGFEIGNHTRSHMGLSTKTLHRLRGELEYINVQCVQHGIPRPVSFAYCGNAVLDDPRAYRILREVGIVWARRGTRPEYSGPGFERVGFPYQPDADHPLLIPSAGIPAPEYTLKHFIESVSMARDGNVAILQFHGVPEGEHPWVHVEQKLFETFMTYLKDNDYQVIALRDLARYVDPFVIPKDHTAIIKKRRADLARQAGEEG